MKQIYLVSTEYLKQNTVLNNNVDDSLLHNAILEASEIELQELLGSKLYKKLLELINNDQINAPENEKYKILLDEYCTKVVLYAALHRAIPYIHYKAVNKGITTQSSDYSSTTSIQEMEFLMNKVKNDLEFFSTRLANHLLANTALYPEYYASRKLDEMIPNTRPYRTSMVLDDGECPCIRSYGFPWRTIDLV